MQNMSSVRGEHKSWYCANLLPIPMLEPLPATLSSHLAHWYRLMVYKKRRLSSGRQWPHDMSFQKCESLCTPRQHGHTKHMPQYRLCE